MRNSGAMCFKVPVNFSALLILCTTVPCLSAHAREYAGDAARAERIDAAPYHKRIAELETRGGAYAGQLPESLQDLGLALQAQGRHAEAVKLFRRGVHLARVNNGLHSATQIPLLQHEIASLKASGNFEAADRRQRYLYRVQLHPSNAGISLADVHMQQADWNFEAYLLGLGDPAMRLQNMESLYARAYNDIVQHEDSESARLVTALQGILRARYLIVDFEPTEQLSYDQGQIADFERERLRLYKSRNYSQGRKIINILYELEQQTNGGNSPGTARTQVMLGDWHLYNDRPDAAKQAYSEAFAELASLDDAQDQTKALLGQPVALPDIDGLRPLTLDEPTQGERDIVLAFSVNQRGRAVGIERLDANEALDGKANRLMRQLRRTQFRPAFVDGQAVETQKIVYSRTVE